MQWTVSHNILLFSLSRLTQLQELNLDFNFNCRDAFSVIGEIISLTKLSFDIHVIRALSNDDVNDDGGGDDEDDDDVHSLIDLRRWVKTHKTVKA